MVKLFLCTILLCIPTGIGSTKMEENPTFELPVDCNSLQIEAYCTNRAVNNWCKWNSKLSICQPNYDPILFISPWDIAATTKSMITLLLLIGCIGIYWFSGLLTRKLKGFRNMEHDKLQKCRIYIFELIGSTLSISLLLYSGTFNIMFSADSYADIDPDGAAELTRSLASCVFMVYLYLIEMLTNDLRWSLQLHHVVIIATCVYYQYLIGSADIASLRCILAMMIFAFTEQNVFAQLLLYRLSPLYSWRIHYISAIIYILTRLFGTLAIIYCYIWWMMTDKIYDQFHGNESIDAMYIIFFFLMPIITILLNVAQFYTVKALFYISKSSKKRIKQRNELRKYPRLQILYDMFVEFDSNDNGYWTMIDWKKFIFYHSTFIRHETCIILWNVLGFTNDTKSLSTDSDSNESVTGSEDENSSGTDYHHHQRRSTITQKDIAGFESKIDIKQIKKPYMKWKDFRAIFGNHVKNESLAHHSVKHVVSAQLQVLLQTIFNAQSRFEQLSSVDDKDKTMLQLYNDVNILIVDDKKKKKKMSKKLSKMVPVEELSPEQRLLSASPPPPSIEMYISDGVEVGIPSPDNIQYTASLNNDILTNKQLELDDAIRQNGHRMSSIMCALPDPIKEQTTI